MAWKIIQLLLLASVTAVWGARPKSQKGKKNLLNVCMYGKHHKKEPSPEDKLHDQVRVGWGLASGKG